MSVFDVLGPFAAVRKETALFPTSSWQEQQRKYNEYLSYWSGSIFETEANNIQVESGRKPLRWPVGINIIRLMTQLHSMAVFGSWEDEIVSFQVEPSKSSKVLRPGSVPAPVIAGRRAQSWQDQLNEIWQENNRETLLIEEDLARNVYGGCAVRVRKDLEMPSGVKLEPVSPYHFHPVWHPQDYHKLLAAKVQFPIGAEQAKILYNADNLTGEIVNYEETWTRAEWEILVDDKKVDGGPNALNMIPYVYIPRLRMEEYYGMSLCDGLMRMQDEFNDRVADIGDQILAECHSMLAMKNYFGNVDELNPSYNGILNLGGNAPGRNDPDLFRIPSGQIPSGALEYIRFILDTAKMSAFAPPIAFGEDEGSQRSGITLVIRMWPLIQQSKWSRAWWNDGLREIARLVLRHLDVYQNKGIEEEWRWSYVKPEWAPIQPKDREAMVAEAVSLISSNLQSPEVLIDRLGDVDNTEEELARIKAWMKFNESLDEAQGPVVAA